MTTPNPRERAVAILAENEALPPEVRINAHNIVEDIAECWEGPDGLRLAVQRAKDEGILEQVGWVTETFPGEQFKDYGEFASAEYHEGPVYANSVEVFREHR